jgi:phospholipid/cholesterol/gamma-HCH transport system substrate-binding protein
MLSISTEAKVGIFVLVSLLILGYMSFRVGQTGFGLKQGYTLTAVFDNVTGLDKAGSVEMAGVQIGKVESISLTDGKALVTMRINPDVKIRGDVTAAIKTHGVLGDKYIDIAPAATGEYLGSGGRIARTESQADLDKVLSQFSSVMDDIKKVSSSLGNTLGGDEGQDQIRSILANLKQITENLNRVVKRNDEKFDQLVDNLKSASREMDRTFSQLADMATDVNQGKGTVGKLLKDKDLADNLNKTLASLQDITNKLNEGKGTLGKLINDEETVNNLNESLTGINRYVNKAEQFRTFLSYRGEYLFRDGGNTKSYLDLRIQPRDDKFYILGAVYDPRGKRTVTDTTVTQNGVTTTTTTEQYERDKFLFNAQIGKRWRDLAFRGGIMESTGGAGLDYYAFNDKLKLTFEAFDFDPDRRPHLKGYAEYRLLKHLFVSAGWDDFVSKEGNSSAFVGFSIRFEDEDLKYLLTSTPIPK